MQDGTRELERSWAWRGGGPRGAWAVAQDRLPATAPQGPVGARSALVPGCQMGRGGGPALGSAHTRQAGGPAAPALILDAISAGAHAHNQSTQNPRALSQLCPGPPHLHGSPAAAW